MKLSNSYNLKVISPEIAKQWHPTKNRDLTPDRITPGCNKKIWWICDKGHEWQAFIYSRTKGSSCPYCAGKRASHEFNLSVLCPEIARQWHPLKNGTLTPDKVTPGSTKKVWWVCDKGHEWQDSIIKRKKNNRHCPFCSHKRVSKEYNLSVLYPEIARQWHPINNGNLTPDNVTPGSNRRVWWICDRGHEWKTQIVVRTTGYGCPKCGANKATKENNLMTLRPDIARQWHPMKNGRLTPEDVATVSKRKVWWLCDKGHEWEDVIRARTKYGNKCPYCYGIDECKDYNLAALHPDLARQWHPTRNGELTAEDVPPGSARKVWWICHKGHEWRASIHSRSNGNNCPYCRGLYPSEDNNLLAAFPQLAVQWHPTKNKKLKPKMVTRRSNKKVWWLCDKGHEWQATIVDRTNNNVRCPYCAGKKASKEYNLLKNYPEIAKQWHPTKNSDLTPGRITPGSNKRVWWLCDKGHEWQEVIKVRKRSGKRCPFCSHQRASKEYNLSVFYPEIAKQWHPTKNHDLTPDKVTPGSNKRVWWLCDKGHEWRVSIGNRSNSGSRCPYCAGVKK